MTAGSARKRVLNCMSCAKCNIWPRKREIFACAQLTCYRLERSGARLAIEGRLPTTYGKKEAQAARSASISTVSSPLRRSMGVLASVSILWYERNPTAHRCCYAPASRKKKKPLCASAGHLLICTYIITVPSAHAPGAPPPPPPPPPPPLAACCIWNARRWSLLICSQRAWVMPCEKTKQTISRRTLSFLGIVLCVSRSCLDKSMDWFAMRFLRRNGCRF